MIKFLQLFATIQIRLDLSYPCIRVHVFKKNYCLYYQCSSNFASIQFIRVSVFLYLKKLLPLLSVFILIRFGPIYPFIRDPVFNHPPVKFPA